MSTENIRKDIAGEVRAAAARAGFNQKDLAAAADISTSAISRKWHGEAPWMVEEIIRVAQVTGVAPSDLLPHVKAVAA